MTAILGIDPGLSGGIAVLTEQGLVPYKMPDTESEVWEVVRDRLLTVAFIEKVSSSPQQGVRSAFTFGRGYGALLMALTAADIPITEVAPGTWQRSMQCLSGGNKNVTKRRAQQLFPATKFTHATADAALIAAFGWRQVHGVPWTQATPMKASA